MYVDFKITESIEQGKVLQMGLVLWVNTDGKSRKLTGIRFPIGAKFARAMRGRGESQVALNEATPLSLANTIELIGFKNVVTNRFPSNNSDTFRGSVKYDNDGNLLYSMTIPLANLPAGGKGSDGKISLMNIAIEYGAPPQTGNQSGNQSGYSSHQVGKDLVEEAVHGVVVVTRWSVHAVAREVQWVQEPLVRQQQVLRKCQNPY